MSDSMNRRSFLSKSSKGLVAIGMVPYFLKSDLNRAFAKSTGGQGMNCRSARLSNNFLSDKIIK